jgi:hypothetical protein
VKRLAKLLVLGVVVYAVATESGRKRVKRARKAYTEEVASGARPIQAVGTSIAAFVGFDEGGGTSHTHPS